MRTLVAGFGNVLRGDDGFGVEVIRRLWAEGGRDPNVELMDVGTGGIRLAQEFLTPYDRLVIVDAMARGGSPGSVYVLAVDAVASTAEIDMHVAVPARALSVAKALGVLPGQIFMVGCEPVEVDELTTELSPPVLAAVDIAIRHVQRLLASGAPSGGPATNGGSPDAPDEEGAP